MLTMLWDIQPGASVSTTLSGFGRLSVIREGDFVEPRLYVVVFYGEYQRAVAVVPDNLSGCYCSTEFPVYKPLKDKLHPRWFHWITKMRWFWEKCDEQSMGTSGKNRIRPEKFLSIEIPVLSVGDQKRLVTWIDNTANKIQETQILFENSLILLGKLRQAILQEAIQGKLIPQDPADEPATELLKRVKAEKLQLTREKKIKEEKPLPPISPDEVPYELPEGWVWVRLGEIPTKLGAGSTPLGGKAVYQNQGIKFIRSQNVWNNGLRLNDVAFITEEINKRMKESVVKPKDILLNITGASIGRSSIVPDGFDVGNVNQHVSIIRLIDLEIRKFIHLCLIAPHIQKLIMDVQVGISREGLSMGRLARFLIPLPPINEQKHIVAKVDELMRLCGELEEQIGQSKEESERLMQAVLREAFEGKDAEESDQKISVA